MLQRIFGKEVASLEAIGFYKCKGNIFNFDILLCKKEAFSFLSKFDQYKDQEFIEVNDKFSVIGELGKELYEEHKESIDKIEEVLNNLNTLYNQEDTISSRSYNSMDNLYLNYLNNEDIVPKDKIEFVNSIEMTDHYAYIEDIKHYLNETKISLLGRFTTPYENAFKPSDDIRMIVNPIPIKEDKDLGYEVIIFIGSGFKGKLMYMSITVKLSEIEDKNILL